MLTVPMGCGGSRSAVIEPRYYESRDTESTWLTSTDTAAGNGTGDNDTAGAATGQKEEKPMTRSSSVKEKKLVNTGTQCGRNTSGTQRRPALRDEVIRDQDEFVSSSDLEKCISNGCSAVNGCRQNESLIKTSQ